MENQDNNAKTDIAEQTYKGPGAVVTSLGYGVIDYKIATIAAAAMGVGISLLNPKGTSKALADFEQSSKSLYESKNIAKKSIGWMGTHFSMLGEWFEKSVPFKHKLKSLFEKSPENWAPVSRLTGMLATVGFFATFFTAAGRGIEAANAGKNQLREAQAEIKKLRAAIAEEHTAKPTPPSVDEAIKREDPKPVIQAETIDRSPLQETSLGRA